MDKRDKLIDAICTVYDNKAYLPSGGITYCNLAVNDVAKIMGCQDLEGKMANAIYEYVSSSENWEEVKQYDCQFLANQGELVLAIQKGDPHGHVCVIRPGIYKESGKWGSVPSVMNIGRENFIGKGLNYAFQDMPKIYRWKDNQLQK